MQPQRCMRRVWKKLAGSLGQAAGALLLALGPSAATARADEPPPVPPQLPSSDTSPESENATGARLHGDPTATPPPTVKKRDPLVGTDGSPENSGNRIPLDARPQPTPRR